VICNEPTTIEMSGTCGYVSCSHIP